MTARRVCLVSPEPIKRRMAGVGIRFLEMARSLARDHDVLLVAPDSEADVRETAFAIASQREVDFKALHRRSDVVVTHGHASRELLRGVQGLDGARLVVDLYDPFHIENLHYAPSLGAEVSRRDLHLLLEQLRHGDFFLCATPEQRTYYLGMLTACGRIDPDRFLDDPALETLIGIVPFGIPQREPRAPRPALRGVVPGLGADDRILFYGGVYDWQDPLTALRALERLEKRRPREAKRLKLVFSMNPHLETTPQASFERARAFARERGWERESVHFVDWLPYEEREAAYLESDVGILTARHGLEVDLSFRTRVLDWLWAGLPCVVTSGGELARWLEDEDIGSVVPPGNPEALADAVDGVLRDPAKARERAERGRILARSRYDWNVVIEPLEAFCRDARPVARESRPAGVRPSDTPSERVSVVIPNYNGAGLLETCLASLLSLDFPRDRLEIIVVDNGSTDDSRELVRSFGPRVRLESNEHNEGFCAAINLGASRANGELLAFLNNDARVTPDWLASMTATLRDGGDDTAAVAGKLLSFDGSRLDFGRGVMMFDGHAMHRDFGLESELDPYRDTGEAFIACGGNMLVRKSVFHDLGGFDDDYFAYLEDVDFSWRLWSFGYRVLFDPQAIAHHQSSATSRKMDPYDREFLNERNAFVTLVKNADDEHFARLLASGLLALLSRNLHVVAKAADEREALGRYPFSKTGYRPSLRPTLTVRHPHSIAHLRVVHYLLEHLDTLLEKRSRVQARRVVPDREIFKRFPTYLVPTYLGDEALFRSRFFRALLPVEPVESALEEMSHG